MVGCVTDVATVDAGLNEFDSCCCLQGFGTVPLELFITVVAIRNYYHPNHGPNNAFIPCRLPALGGTVVGPNKGPKPFLFITGSHFLFKSECGILGKNFPSILSCPAYRT